MIWKLWSDAWLASLLVHCLFYIAIDTRKTQKPSPKAPAVGHIFAVNITKSFLLHLIV